MSIFLFVFLFCLVPMEAQYSINRRSSCPQPDMNHGHARLRQRGRMARFVCYPGFELVGDKYATCRGGQWDVPTPVCVRDGCQKPVIKNAFLMAYHNEAWLNVFCFPGYKGSTTLFCDGRHWNGTIPTCEPDSKNVQLECDFESSDICGWVQDERHDFDWTRINKKTPSAFLFTGPAFDHTLGEGKSGHYMYIESSSKSENDTARLISPVYNGSLEKNGCFSMFYHMYGRSTGGLKVYQIPESQKEQILNEEDSKNRHLLFEKWGNQGDKWYRSVSMLKDVSDNFQIVIEGIRGSSFTSDIAIDDVAILQGNQCDVAIATAVTPSSDIPDSCAGRCVELSAPRVPARGCGCSIHCIGHGDCCPDFIDLCVFNPDLASTDDDDITTSKNPSDLPRTEKLIAPTQSTTTTTTTSTSTTTTTTPRPTTTSTTTTTHKPTTTTPKPTTVKTIKATKVTLKPKVTTVPPPTPTTIKTTTIQYGTALPEHLTTKLIKATNTTIDKRQDVEKARKEQAIEAKKVVKAKPESSSSSAAGIVVLLMLVVCCAGAGVAARSARGRAALARLRARAGGDPEVRYLTRDQD